MVKQAPMLGFLMAVTASLRSVPSGAGALGYHDGRRARRPLRRPDHAGDPHHARLRFHPRVLGLDPEVRRAWSAIYAEGHAREPNPLASALTGAGAELGRAGRVDEAMTLLRKAIAMDPTSARTRTIMGSLFVRQGRLEDAARELDAAKRIDFREVWALTELGFVLLELGREEEALVELRDVLRIERRAPRAYVGIGMILARRERTGEAIAAPPGRTCSTATC